MRSGYGSRRYGGGDGVRVYETACQESAEKEFRDTFQHMDDVKEELCHVRDDMTGMAKTLKNQM